MLTDKQLKKLEPLTKHPKYGPIVKAAIVGWKRCRPSIGMFGVATNGGKFIRDKAQKGCCFLGAAVLNRKYNQEGWVIWQIVKKFKLNDLAEAWALSDGFENHSMEYCKEAHNFGKKVRKALDI